MSVRAKSVAVLIAEAALRRVEGHRIINMDNPMARMLGWADIDTGEHYEIPLTCLKETLGDLSKLARDLIKTPAGRAKLFGVRPEYRPVENPEAVYVITDTTPTLELRRPLTRAHLADAFALIERVDQRVAEVLIHPDDLAEVHKDQHFEIDSDGCLWTAKIIPELRSQTGEILLIGDDLKDTATAVLRLIDEPLTED